MPARPGRSDPNRRFAITLAAAGLAVALLSSAGAARAAAPRLVAVADVHGAFDALTGILTQARLIDDAGSWTGGSAVLIQTGDYFDRGVRVREVVDLLMTLERQAPKTGGRVRVLLGNHEVMNLAGETRDVNPEVYATFVDRNSEKRRERAWKDFERLAEARETTLGSRPNVYDATREDWMAAHPPGMLEYLEAVGPDGAYGKWLRARPVVVEIDGTVLMHAGLNPDTAPPTLALVNDQVHADIKSFDTSRRYLIDRKIILPFFTLNEIVAAALAEAESLKSLVDRANQGDRTAAERLRRLEPEHLEAVRGVLTISETSLFADDGPMWFRGFASWSDEEGPARIQPLLDKYHVQRFVTGHTPQRPSNVQDRFGHRVFLIDTGMLSSTYTGGRASALEISGGTITAIYADSTTVLAGPGR